MARMRWMLGLTTVTEYFFRLNHGDRLQQTAPAIALAVVLTLSAGMVGCRGNRTAETPDSSNPTAIDNSLTFNNVTFKQAGDDGNPLWEVQADQVIYSQDQQLAQVTAPKGVLYDGNRANLRVQARTGEIQQDGKRIVLTGQVVATDLKSGAVIRANKLEWAPDTGVIVMQGNIVGTHPKVRFSGQEARLVNAERRLDASGKVVILSSDPRLRIQSERLAWFLDDNRVTSEQRVLVGRLNKDDQIIDTAAADKAQVNLETQVATLQQNAQIEMRNPSMQVQSNSLVWNLEQETIVSNQPVTINQRQQQVLLNANQGRMDMKRNVVSLRENVRAVSRRNRSELEADQLTWNIPTQRLQAEGNVDYRQNSPRMRVQGPRAFGRLDNQTVVVSGGRVVSEIYPE